jgi:hypothetical protein
MVGFNAAASDAGKDRIVGVGLPGNLGQVRDRRLIASPESVNCRAVMPIARA